MNFVNFSNHPSARWDDDQLRAARNMIAPAENQPISDTMVLGTVVDLPFPQMNASMTLAEVEALSSEQIEAILDRAPGVVLAAGEIIPYRPPRILFGVWRN